MALIQLPEWLIRFAAHAELYGLPVILSFICLLQYTLHLYYRYCTNSRELHLISDLKNLEGEMNDLQRDRYLARIENVILRDIFSQTATGRSVELLLKKFIPNSSQGFVIFFCRESQNLDVFLQRGLSPRTTSQIRLEPEWIQQLLNERVLRITSAELAKSQFASTLSARERKKIEELHLFAVADHNEIFGIIATSHLFPACVDVTSQQELVIRILESITGSLRQTMQLVDQQHLLKLTQEKLALRAIADRNHDSPPRLIDDYLSRLTSLVEADRGFLVLFTQNPALPCRVISRQGQPMQSGLEALWKQHELCLGRWARHLKRSCSLNSAELADIGIDSLLGSALILPIIQHSKLIGICCLTRQDQGLFSHQQINLADWAASFLAETLLRVLDRVEVERMASMDGLTELANRRTFDARIQRELQKSQRSGAECSLLLLDLDHFKKINDVYGHQAGDEVLRHFARLLEIESRKLRSTDTPLVARYGGEEMAILLPGVGQNGALRIAESIRIAAEDSVVLYQRQRIRISVSIGVSCYPRHAASVEDLIQQADKALYHAKRTGRNRVCAVSSDNEVHCEQPAALTLRAAE